jgi:beta-hydroxylase
MFFDPARFPFTAEFTRNYAAIKAELSPLHPPDYVRYAQEDAYEGAWLLFPISTHDPNWFLADACRVNRRRCPVTAGLLDRVPGLLLAGFSRLEEGTRIHPHVDRKCARSLRSHFGLVIPENAWIKVDGVQRRWEPGSFLTFEAWREHEVLNAGPGHRVVLTMDVDLGRAEEPMLPG